MYNLNYHIYSVRKFHILQMKWWKYRKGNNLHSVIRLPVAAPSIVLKVSTSCSCWPPCSDSSRIHRLIETPYWSMETGLSHMQGIGRALGFTNTCKAVYFRRYSLETIFHFYLVNAKKNWVAVIVMKYIEFVTGSKRLHLKAEPFPIGSSPLLSSYSLLWKAHVHLWGVPKYPSVVQSLREYRQQERRFEIGDILIFSS